MERLLMLVEDVEVVVGAEEAVLALESVVAVRLADVLQQCWNVASFEETIAASKEEPEVGNMLLEVVIQMALEVQRLVREIHALLAHALVQGGEAAVI